MPQTKEQNALASLELNEKQLQYLQSDGATIEGLGVTTDEYNRWLKEPLFRVLNELVEGYLVERDEIEEVLNEIKAATLVAHGVTYKSIEHHLELYPGTLLEWTNSMNDSGGKFSEAMKIFEDEKPETQQQDRQIAESEHATRANQSQAIQLILEGKNNREVADEIGVSRQTVSYWQNHDEHFRTQLNNEIKARADALRARFASVLDAAYESLTTLLQSDDPQIKLKAAVEVLKRNRSSRV